MSLSELYQEVILHHSKSPRNFGPLEGATHLAHGHNPLCGDKLTLYLSLQDGVVHDVKFEGEGCAISTASASVMTDILKGKSELEARALFQAFLHLTTGEGEGPGADSPDLGKLQVFAGVREFPVRVKCAMLAWRTLESALADAETTVSTE